MNTSALVLLLPAVILLFLAEPAKKANVIDYAVIFLLALLAFGISVDFDYLERRLLMNQTIVSLVCRSFCYQILLSIGIIQWILRELAMYEENGLHINDLTIEVKK